MSGGDDDDASSFFPSDTESPGTSSPAPTLAPRVGSTNISIVQTLQRTPFCFFCEIITIAVILFTVIVSILVLTWIGHNGEEVLVRDDLRVQGNDLLMDSYMALKVNRSFVPSTLFPPGTNLVLGEIGSKSSSARAPKYASIRALTAIGTRIRDAFLSLPGEPGLVELHTPFASIFSLPVVSLIGFFSPSDSRGKQDIHDLSPQQCLATVEALRPVSYHWTSEFRQAVGMTDDREQWGLIAQEVEQVFPQAVIKKNMSIGSTQYNDWRDLDKEMIVPLLIGSIKELQQRIHELEQPQNGRRNTR